ncbi:MAG: S-adenosylmethionine:tRNA ribosyltransferase-isomerase [Prevotellaceae bacterium]|nr:S-adenosylmethionine:tRNA ribosyltransferase-isomerase [Prevotellaceae bacterium]
MKPENLNINDFNYYLPDEKIAKYPLSERDRSKLLHFKDGKIAEHHFYDLPQLLDSKDFLICNNTKVIQARLLFEKISGAKIEIFCLEPFSPADYQMNFQTTKSCVWKTLIGNLKRWKSGNLQKEITVNNEKVVFEAKYIEAFNDMSHLVEFQWRSCCEFETRANKAQGTDYKSAPANTVTFGEILQNFGELPIPPYLNRKTEDSDKTTYQTVYSKIDGSVAAPTAGLHFTPEVLQKLSDKGVKINEITLHVGAGTFQPVKSEQIGGHPMHSEIFSVKKSVIEQIINNLDNIVAVGTTSVRTLESLYYIGCEIIENAQNPQLLVNQWIAYENKFSYTVREALNAIVNYLNTNNLQSISASTKIIIAPSFQFKIARKIITNFHQPKSTLLLLVSAFTGEENRQKIYDFALKHDFRFLSYGDSSLLEK